MDVLTPDLLVAAEQPPGWKFPPPPRLVRLVSSPTHHSSLTTHNWGEAPRVIVSRPMIRHIVMWKLRGPSAEEKRSQAEPVKAALLGMFGKIPGMTQVEVGIGATSGEQEADIVLQSPHESWQASADYQQPPAPQPVKQLIGALRIERRVVDF